MAAAVSVLVIRGSKRKNRNEPPTALVGQSLYPPLVSNSASVFAPTVVADGLILAPLVNGESAVYPPTIRSDAAIAMPLVTNSTSVFGPTLKQNIAMPLVSNATDIFLPTIAAEGVIGLPLVVNTTTVYAPTLALNMNLPLVTNASAIYAPAIVPEESIYAPLVTNSTTVYGPTLTRTLRMPLVTNPSGIFPPSITAPSTPGFALSTPTATVTSAAGAALEVSIAMGADIWAGYKLRIQRSLSSTKNVSDGSYVTPTLNIVHFVVDSEVAALAITNADMVIDGYIDPSGAGFQQYRWERDDGAISNWSEISYNVTASAAVFATVNGPNRSDRLNLPTSANNLRISNNDWGAPYKARLTLPGAEAGQFESTQEAWANSSDFILIGIDDGSYDFDNANEGSIPGNTGLTRGVSLRIDASGGYTIYRNGSFQSGALSYPVGSTVSVVSRKTAGTVTFYVTPPSGSPALLATISGQSWMASGYYGFGGATRADTHKFNCGATSFVRSLGVGEVQYG